MSDDEKQQRWKSEMNQGGKRILVLDRSRTIQILLAHAFQNAGHQVIICTKPQEVLAVLAGIEEMPDVLFLDIDYEKETYKVMRYVRETLYVKPFWDQFGTREKLRTQDECNKV